MMYNDNIPVLVCFPKKFSQLSQKCSINETLGMDLWDH